MKLDKEHIQLLNFAKKIKIKQDIAGGIPIKYVRKKKSLYAYRNKHINEIIHYNTQSFAHLQRSQTKEQILNSGVLSNLEAKYDVDVDELKRSVYEKIKKSEAKSTILSNLRKFCYYDITGFVETTADETSRNDPLTITKDEITKKKIRQ